MQITIAAHTFLIKKFILRIIQNFIPYHTVMFIVIFRFFEYFDKIRVLKNIQDNRFLAVDCHYKILYLFI